jgi:hypothetical protein
LELRRNKIAAQLSAGARVQRGALSASMETYEAVYFTAEAVAVIVSVEVVAAIKSQIPPSVKTRLNVVENK